MLLGLAVIAVPLLVAILNAALQIRALADLSRVLVVEGVSAARATQDLASEIDSLDRTARQYQVLANPKLLDVYRTQNAELTDALQRLSGHLRSTQEREALDEIAHLQESVASAVLSASKDPAQIASVSDRFAALRALAARIAQQSSAEIDERVAGIQRRSSAARAPPRSTSAWPGFSGVRSRRSAACSGSRRCCCRSP